MEIRHRKKNRALNCDEDNNKNEERMALVVGAKQAVGEKKNIREMKGEPWEFENNGVSLLTIRSEK